MPGPLLTAAERVAAQAARTGANLGVVEEAAGIGATEVVPVAGALVVIGLTAAAVGGGHHK